MRKLRFIAALAAMALVAGACGSDESGEFALVAEDTLTVCTDSPYPPMEFELNGEFTGFDIELMRAIATELGLTLAVNNSGFDPITSGLAMESGICDIAAASITITDEREENIDFSDPYFSGDQTLLVKTSSGIANLAGMAGMNIGVQSGTTGEIFANDNNPGGTVVSFANPGDVFTALEAGSVDGVINDIVVNGDKALNDDSVAIVETFTTNEFYGFAVKEDGKEALLDAVNDALEKFDGDGTYDNIFDDWF